MLLRFAVDRRHDVLRELVIEVADGEADTRVVNRHIAVKNVDPTVAGECEIETAIKAVDDKSLAKRGLKAVSHAQQSWVLGFRLRFC